MIQLYTFEDEIVLDPFAGSGTTCIAAIKTSRKYVSYDVDKKYCDLAERLVLTSRKRLEVTFGTLLLRGKLSCVFSFGIVCVCFVPGEDREGLSYTLFYNLYLTNENTKRGLSNLQYIRCC